MIFLSSELESTLQVNLADKEKEDDEDEGVSRSAGKGI